MPRFVGSVDASISSGELLVQGQTRGGEAIVEGFSDDAYMVKLDVDLNSGTHADLWVRYRNVNHGYFEGLDSQQAIGFGPTTSSPGRPVFQAPRVPKPHRIAGQ